jgi:hypothetical protein
LWLCCTWKFFLWIFHSRIFCSFFDSLDSAFGIFRYVRLESRFWKVAITKEKIIINLSFAFISMSLLKESARF